MSQNLIQHTSIKLLLWKAVNVQMALSLQSGLRSVRQCIPELMASGQSQRKPENFNIWSSNEKKDGILQKKLIVFPAVLAFLREMIRYQHLTLLHCFAFWCRNQGVEEVQEHGILSACWRTTVSLRLSTQIRRRKR